MPSPATFQKFFRQMLFIDSLLIASSVESRNAGS
jgi:hypothetical protein